MAEYLKAPKGSFYYRFASRDALLGELSLTTVLAYQEEFVAAIQAGDGLGAALHTPAWSRRISTTPGFSCSIAATISFRATCPRRSGAACAEQAERVEACLARFARDAFGRAGPAELRAPNSCLRRCRWPQ